MPTQNPDHGAHIALPAEVARLEKAVAFFTEQNDQKMLSQIVPQLDGAKERLGHAVKAAEFVAMLGLHTHEVTLGTYTVNDAINVVAKTLHEHEHHESGKFEVKPLYHRAHAHLLGANQGGTPEQHARAAELRALFTDAPEVVKEHVEKVAAGLVQEHPHCDPDELGKPRDSHAELVEHLGLTDPAHIEAAKALFQKVTV